MITRFRSGVSSMVINPSFSANLIAARTFALPMLARSAIRAYRYGTSPRGGCFVTDDRKHGHSVQVEMVGHWKGDNYRSSEKSTAPHHTPSGLRHLAILLCHFGDQGLVRYLCKRLCLMTASQP